MPVDLRGVVTVLLPGTGSDDEYLTRAFADPLRAVRRPGGGGPAGTRGALAG